MEEKEGYVCDLKTRGKTKVRNLTRRRFFSSHRTENPINQDKNKSSK